VDSIRSALCTPAYAAPGGESFGRADDELLTFLGDRRAAARCGTYAPVNQKCVPSRDTEKVARE
jgi:hypothetical protein